MKITFFLKELESDRMETRSFSNFKFTIKIFIKLCRYNRKRLIKVHQRSIFFNQWSRKKNTRNSAEKFNEVYLGLLSDYLSLTPWILPYLHTEILPCFLSWQKGCCLSELAMLWIFYHKTTATKPQIKFLKVMTKITNYTQ